VNSGSSGAFAIQVNENNSSNAELGLQDENEISKFSGEFFEKAFNAGFTRK